MPPTNADLIRGLNLIHAPPTPTTSLASDADLLAAGPYSDLSAQLDLWSNVAFASDEPFVAGQDTNGNGGDEDGEKKDLEAGGAAGDMKRRRDLQARKKLQLIQAQQQQQQSSTSTFPAHQPPTMTVPGTAPYDLPGLLSMAGNPFPAQTMNINQLLAMQAFPNPFQTGFPFHPQIAFPHPATAATPAVATSSTPLPKSQTTPAKRPKNRKTSANAVRGTTASSEGAESSQSPSAEGDDGGQQMDDGGDSSRPLNNAEDKRRRNTQASARFRLKKKEREHAMEVRSKELEAKVSELEKECEALRRENGWLKGLVVGVTGGPGMQMTMPTGPVLTAMPASSSGSKRKRNDGGEH